MKEASEDFLQDVLSSFIGEIIRFICPGISYVGELVRVGSEFIEIGNPDIFYDVGYDDAPMMPDAIYLQISAIQSFWIVK